MKKIILINFLILFLFHLYGPVNVKPTQNTAPMHLFVIGGQSNAIGEAKVPRPQLTDPRILKWKNDSWVLGSEPTHPGGGYGFAESFGLQLLGLLNNPNYTIGLIPCAIGGSSIISWQKGQRAYETCLYKINLVKAATPNASLDGVIFYQGESDTISKARANSWPAYFKQFVHSFRIDVGNPNLPIIFAQIGPNPHSPTHPAWTRLQTLQYNTVSSMDPNIKMFVTKNLSVVKYGNTHLDVLGEVTVGKRAANIYYKNFVIRVLQEDAALDSSTSP